MRYVSNKELIANVFDYDVVLYGMGINNSMNKGLSYEIALNFPKVREAEWKMPYGNKNKLGTLHSVTSDGITFVSCYSNNGGYRKNTDGSFIDISSLRECLNKVRGCFKGKKIASPLIGSNRWDGNYDKDKIRELYEHMFDGFDIDVYDDDITDFKDRMYFEIFKYKRMRQDRQITIEEYNDKRSEIEWKKKNGIFVKRPDDFVFRRKREGDFKQK